MPTTPAIDVSIRPLPKDIARRYGELDAYRHIFREIFHREQILDEGIPIPELEAQMNAHNIQGIVVSGYDARRTTGLYIENDWVAELSKQLPNRVIGGVGLDPLNDIIFNLDEIDRCTELYNFQLVRLFPYATRLSPMDSRYYPIFAKCAKLGLPIWTQVGHNAGLFPSDPGRPIYLDQVALDFPSLKIIGGHIGWPWHDEMIAMALKHPNIYISTSAHAPDHWPATSLDFFRTRGKRKVIFGSNWPYITYERYFEKYPDLKFSLEWEKGFLRDNFLRAVTRASNVGGGAGDIWVRSL